MGVQVITAPEELTNRIGLIDTIFLAGGISDCPNWQLEVIAHLERILDPWLDPGECILICNPRRENFPINDPEASIEQIEWEFDWLSKCDIFSMYFCNSPSVQPICMYELGRYIAKKQYATYKTSLAPWKNDVVVSIEGGYSRELDVLHQCRLTGVSVNLNATPETHAYAIAKALTNRWQI